MMTHVINTPAAFGLLKITRQVNFSFLTLLFTLLFVVHFCLGVVKL